MTPKTLAQARRLHVDVDVARLRLPVHLEKTSRGYRPTDRAHCAICPPEQKGGGR